MKAEAPLSWANRSLDGLSVGDGFGEKFFMNSAQANALIAQRALPEPPWRVTDDTIMAMGIVQVLAQHQAIDQQALAAAFAANYRADPYRGYGGMAHRILQEISLGADWRAASAAAFNGMGSFGNGAAMRAAPVGGYFSDDFKRAAAEARLSAEVTHAHPEGIGEQQVGTPADNDGVILSDDIDGPGKQIVIIMFV